MATGLDQKQIDIACGDAKTKLPNGLTAPAFLAVPGSIRTTTDRNSRAVLRSAQTSP